MAPIAIIDFGKVAVSKEEASFGGGARTTTTVARVQDENVMIPAAPAEEPMMTRNLWRRVRDKAFWQSPRSLWQGLS